MQSAIKVSVVIAAYNAGKYLRQAIASLTYQTLKEIEIILVDDKSTDETLAIMNEYALRDSRIKVFRHEEDTPGGGEARNIGIEAACGEYLSILDADDFFAPVMLEHAYNRARDTGADVVIFDGDIFNDETQHIEKCDWILKKHNLPDTDEFAPRDNANLIFDMTIGSAWNLLVKHSLIDEKHIRFESLHNTNDSLFCMLTLALAGSIAVLREKLICYRRNNGHSIFANISKHPLDGCKAMLHLQHELQERSIYNIFRQGFLGRLHGFLFSYYLPTIWQNDRNAYVELYKSIKDEYEAAWCMNELMEEISSADPETIYHRKLLEKCATPEEFEYRAYANRRIIARPPYGARIVIYGAGHQAKEFFRHIFRTGEYLLAGWVADDYLQAGFPVEAPSRLMDVQFDYVFVALDDEQSSQAAKSYLSGIGIATEKICRINVNRGGAEGAAVSVILSVKDDMSKIARTLDSICGQTLRNLEILVMDGGSTDGTAEFVRQRSKEDQRVRILTAAELSQGARLNLGLLQARGEYLLFCEPGDYADRNMLAHLYEAAQKHNYPEVVKADYKCVLDTDNGEFAIKFGVLPRYEHRLYGEEISPDHLPEVLVRDLNPWNGIYRISFLRQYGLKVCEADGVMLPQASFVVRAHLCAKREIYLEEALMWHCFPEDVCPAGAGRRALLTLVDVLQNLTEVKGRCQECIVTALKHMIQRCVFWYGLERFLQMASKSKAINDYAYCVTETVQAGKLLQDYLMGQLNYKDQEKLLTEESVAWLTSQPNIFLAQAEAEMCSVLSCQQNFVRCVGKYHRAIIFGAGERGCSSAAMLMAAGYDGEICFCDNNESLVGKRVQGCRVFSPSQAARDLSAIIILPTPEYAPNMRQQLLDEGADGARIIDAAEVWPTELVGLGKLQPGLGE